MRVNGEPRTSLITTPNGLPPARKAGAPAAPRFGGGRGAFDSYESRSLGDSIGWWEGDTLVVETTNIPQNQHFMGAWEHLKVTEKFTRVGKGRLHYQFTVDDPTVWDASWGGEYEFSPMDGVIYEYACHEGNYALPGILAGARAEEAEKAAAAAKAGPAATTGTAP